MAARLHDKCCPFTLSSLESSKACLPAGRFCKNRDKQMTLIVRVKVLLLFSCPEIEKKSWFEKAI
jgi:hypothetical protein